MFRNKLNLTKKLINRIEVNPAILIGKPIIRGTRIPVELILKMTAQGITIVEILDEYPRLTKEDIYAALEYAHKVVEAEEIYPLVFAPQL
ncbi:MAG: DUF433 domain-containing protein [Patescibacteria group bacterium]